GMQAGGGKSAMASPSFRLLSRLRVIRDGNASWLRTMRNQPRRDRFHSPVGWNLTQETAMSTNTFARTALLGCALALASVGAGSAAFAQSHDNRGSCGPKGCEQHAQKSHQAAPAHKVAPAHKMMQKTPPHHASAAPRVGEKIHGTRVDYGHYKHLPKPRAHTHYERYGNRVVLVNDSTLQVLAIVGLTSVLLANN
ncbi:RcnB family protein, partial [Thioclava sp. BHET1]